MHLYTGPTLQRTYQVNSKNFCLFNRHIWGNWLQVHENGMEDSVMTLEEIISGDETHGTGR